MVSGFRMEGIWEWRISGAGFTGLNGNVLITELQRTNEELASTRNRLMACEEKAKQTRQVRLDLIIVLQLVYEAISEFQACEAWKREAEDQRRRAQLAEQERVKVEQEKDAVSFAKFMALDSTSHYRILFRSRRSCCC